MTVFFLSSSKNEARKLLSRILDIIVSPKNIIIIKDSSELEYHLRHRSDNNIVALLQLKNKNELTDIFLLKNLLGNIPIILVLPDRENNTIALGYKLCPRFIAYADSDFLDVASVMIKIKNKIDAEESYL
jgi:hypothetical protein